MAHMTNKKRALRDKNRKGRVESGFNTGTRDMGYKSNNERKVAYKKKEQEDENCW